MMVSKLPKKESENNDQDIENVNQDNPVFSMPDPVSSKPEEDSIESLRNLIFNDSETKQTLDSQNVIVPFGSNLANQEYHSVLPQFEDDDFINPVDQNNKTSAGSFNPFVDDSYFSANSKNNDQNSNINEPVIIPPFVVDEVSEQKDPYSHTLAENIKNGTIPAESIRILISADMTDSEIIPIARDMGINWKLTPGDDTDDKIQFLINYFNRIHHRESVFEKPDQTSADVTSFEFTDDWLESENRLQELKESLDFTEVTPEEIKYPFFIQLLKDFQQSSPIIKNSTVLLGLISVVLLFLIVYFLFPAPSQEQIPSAATPTAANSPIPIGLQFSGGWKLNLITGKIIDGKWQPKEAEWLQGTEICRMVSLPWSKQLEAVFRTAVPGDEILLIMNNSDQLKYKVESLKLFQENEINQFYDRVTPCMVIILNQLNSNSKRVIVAAPAYK